MSPAVRILSDVKFWLLPAGLLAGAIAVALRVPDDPFAWERSMEPVAAAEERAAAETQRIREEARWRMSVEAGPRRYQALGETP